MASAQLPKAIGWIGLGLMGDPMARNLLKKTDADTKFYIYDVVPEAVEKFVKDGQGRVQTCSSSKEVAERSVRRKPPFTPLVTGNSHSDGWQGLRSAY